MICLDTNYLIRALIPDTEEARRVNEWLAKGEAICAPAVVWYEFLCGPVFAEEMRLGKAILTAGILAFHEAQAAEAARLFHAVKRPRRLRVDAMIAGTTIVAGAALATSNRADFEPFVAHGLVLAATEE
jgi:predicted nucleic acid-binding protein